MKCDELKDYDYDPDFPFQSRGRFYVADEVDAAIDELKQKLQDQCISCPVKMQEDDVVAEKDNEIRRLKRALWLARADRAMMTLDYFTLKCRWFKDYMKVEPPKCDVKMIPKWANVKRKCWAKAEEYK